MIYFSELKNKRVFTEDRILVGRLQDVIFLTSDKPSITKLVVKPHKKNATPLVIPLQYVQKLNAQIIIEKEFTNASLAENELFIEKNLLDKQIIDIKGSKIVRVNDVAIQNKPSYYVAGVDIGILGLLRWLKLEDTVLRIAHALNFPISSNFLSWVDIQPLELARGKVQMKRELENLEKIRPEDLAYYLESTNTKNINKILNVLDEKFAVEVIGSLNLNYQHQLFRNFSDHKAAKIISLIDPDEAVDILLTLSPRRRELITNNLVPHKRETILHLLKLSKTPIGEHITSEFLTVHPENTVKDVVSVIKSQSADFSFVPYIYVVNRDDQLMGVLNLHELLLQQPDTPVYKFMFQNVIVIHLTTPEEIAVHKMLKYKLQALPVIDRDRKILGVVTIDDLSEFIMGKI